MRTLFLALALCGFSVPAFGQNESQCQCTDCVFCDRDNCNCQAEPTGLIGNQVDALVSRVNVLERKVSELEENMLTEEDVRRIVREEIQIQIKSSDGRVTNKSVSLDPVIERTSSTQVSVPGYEGTFQLNPGERIVAINGVPVGDASRVVLSSNTPAYRTSSGSYTLEATPSRSSAATVRVGRTFSSPVMMDCSSGTCRPVSSSRGYRIFGR